MNKKFYTVLRIFFVLALGGLSGCNSPNSQREAQSEQAQNQNQTQNEVQVVKEPGQTGGICGGIAGFRCGDRLDYCHYDRGVCRKIADATGICTKPPEVCTRDYRPVCGCDGNTYSNECVANSAGISVAAVGACRS